MNEREIVIYVCHNSVPAGTSVSALARRAGNRGQEACATAITAVVREVPCSGKIDPIYLLKAFEGGVRGVAVITCPLGECHLAEGNMRAQVRVGLLGRLLDEIGLGHERLLLLHCATGQEGRDVPTLIEQAVAGLSALPENPLRKTTKALAREPK